MTNLEKFVNLIIKDIPVPSYSSIGTTNDCDEEIVYVNWVKNKNIVTLYACSHKVWIVASKDDDGPCPSEREFSYVPARLHMLLEWMQKEQNISVIDKNFQKNARFHSKFDDDPLVTEFMFGGRITESELKFTKST